MTEAEDPLDAWEKQAKLVLAGDHPAFIWAPQVLILKLIQVIRKQQSYLKEIADLEMVADTPESKKRIKELVEEAFWQTERKLKYDVGKWDT